MSDLSLQSANAIIEGALAHSVRVGYRPMALVVLDSHGNIKALQRQEGATVLRIDIASGKAWAAVSMGTSSRALWQRANENPSFFSALAVTAKGKFIPQTGAVLIKDGEGKIVGAVGASGGTGDEDEEICIVGVRSAGLVAG